MVDNYLRRHDGVITLTQAAAAGMHREAVRRRVVSGRWRRLSPGVFFADDRPFTDAARIRSVVWGYGPTATASGAAAAWWHRLISIAPDLVEVTVPRAANGRGRSGSTLRRRDLPQTDVVERRGLRVTSLPLTVLEAAVHSGGTPIMDRALQRATELPELWRAQVRNKGRYGSPRARMLLQAAGGGARSEAERLHISLLNAAHITGWVANYPVGGYLVDVAFPQHKVAIEIDGWAFHSDVADFVADRTRQNKLALLGWQVLRFTWWDLTQRPERVIAVIRQAISA